MTPTFSRQLMVRLSSASPEERKRIIAAITPHDLLMLDADFETWAQDGQLAPLEEGWRVWLMMAGRGFGKTRAGAEWIHKLACGRKPLRIALVAASISEARAIMVEGVSGILSVAGRNQPRVTWEPSVNRLRWRGGSQAQLFSGDSPDGLRGPEHDFAWCAASARRAGRAGGRRAAARDPAVSPGDRQLLYRWKQPERRLVRPCSADRGIHQRRLALHRAARGHERLRPD